MLFASAHKKCLAQKVRHLGLLRPIPMIQPPFCSYCVALQYEPGMKFFHQVVPELCDIKKPENLSTTAWCFCTFSPCVWRLLLKMPGRWVLYVSHQGFRTATSSSRLRLKYFGMVHAYRLQYADRHDETHADKDGPYLPGELTCKPRV